MAFIKQAAFTKKTTDLPDKPSPTYTAASIKTYMQTPSDELMSTLNKLVDDLNANYWVDRNKIKDLEVIRSKIALGAVGTDQLDPAIFGQPKDDLGIQAKFQDHDEQLADIVQVVNAKKYGIDPTGVNDSATAIRNAINAAKALIVDNNFTKQALVEIPAGRYRINTQIIVSQFVKIKAVGMVIFETYTSNDSAFWFTPDATDPTFTSIMNKQQWFRSPFINGVDGGFLFVNKLDKATSNSTAIEIGSRSDLSGKPFSRFSACDFAIENYNLGMKFNAYNTYIASFDRVHLELNNTHVRFGNEGQTVTNSGENIHFSNSVFAIADTAFEWLCDGFDLRLVNCSNDFIQRIFYMKRGWRNISFFGGHIEGIGNRVADTTLQGGIAVFDVTNTSDNPVHLSINGTSALVRKDVPMFRCSVSDKLRISLENFHYRNVDTFSTADKQWLADSTVIVDKKNIFYQGEGILPSKRVNNNHNFNFINDADTSGTSIGASPPVGYAVTKQFAVSDKIVSTEGYDGGKSIEYISSDNTGYIKLTDAEFIPVRSGQTVIATAAIKSTNISLCEVKTRINFYDRGQRLIQTGALIPIKTGFLDNVWNYPIKPTIAVAPSGSVYYKVEYVMAGCNGVAGYMSGLFSTVMA